VEALRCNQLPQNTIQVLGRDNLSALINENIICAVTAIAGNQNLAVIKKLLAHRVGSITPLVEFPSELYPKYNEAAYSLMTYLIIEKTRTENLVARGGNTQLFNLQE